jgi:hypothetical protein
MNVWSDVSRLQVELRKHSIEKDDIQQRSYAARYSTIILYSGNCFQSFKLNQNQTTNKRQLAERLYCLKGRTPFFDICCVFIYSSKHFSLSF